MIDFAEHSISHDRAANEGTIARRLGAEIENLRAAYRWCRSNGEHAMSARLVSALLDEAVLRERAEVERWADELVTIDRCVNTEWGARVLAIAANAALVRGDFDRSAELAAQGSVALRAGALPTWVIANVRYMLGASHDLGKTGEVTASRGRHLDDMRAYSSQTGDPIGRAVASFSESFVHAAFGAHDRAIGPAITAVRLGRAGDSPTLAAMGSFTIANARAHVNPERAARQALDAARSARVANCSLVERHADRLEFDLSGSSSNEDLESRLERALAHVRVAHESGHREQTLQEIAGVVAPLVRLGRLTEAATILGGLERTLWGSLRTIIDARQHLISHLGLPTYQRLSRPSRRLTWHQLADLTAPMKR